MDLKSHPDLLKKTQKARFSLSKRGLDGQRADVMLLLDHSGSMRVDYRDGVVQTLVDRALAFALAVDDDGVVPVVPFDSFVHDQVVVGVHNYQGVVDRELWRPKAMGRTNLAAALRVVFDAATGRRTPLFVIIVTDGSPDSRPAATAEVIRLSGLPVFLKFLAVAPVDYLRDLDDLPAHRRRVDNVDAKYLPSPGGMSDLEFADALTDEWAAWLAAARTAGILDG